MDIKAAVITVSDRSSAGVREDVSGPLAKRLLEEAGIEVLETTVVPDDVRSISEAIQTVGYREIDLILTTGGTGISPEDYTARAMDPLLRFDIPGIAEAIRLKGVKNGQPYAMLSRGRAGVMVFGRNRTLVVNVAGSVGAVEDAMEVLLPILEHTVDQMRGGDH